jgi:hypothetical protein
LCRMGESIQDWIGATQKGQRQRCPANQLTGTVASPMNERDKHRKREGALRRL